MDDSAIDLESRIELGNLRTELAKLQPQMELAVESARKSARDLRESLCTQQKKVREQAEKLKQQIQPEEQKLKIQIERLRQEITGNWLEL